MDSDNSSREESPDFSKNFKISNSAQNINRPTHSANDHGSRSMSYWNISKSGKYDHVQSKVKQYRIKIQQQSEDYKRRKSLEVMNYLEEHQAMNNKKIDNAGDPNYNVLEIKEIKQENEVLKSQVFDLQKQVADFQIRLDSMRLKMSDMEKVNNGANAGYYQSLTPLKVISNVFMTPVRTLSNSFLRNFSKSDLKPNNNVIVFSDSGTDLDEDSVFESGSIPPKEETANILNKQVEDKQEHRRNTLKNCLEKVSSFLSSIKKTKIPKIRHYGPKKDDTELLCPNKIRDIGKNDFSKISATPLLKCKNCNFSKLEKKDYHQTTSFSCPNLNKETGDKILQCVDETLKNLLEIKSILLNSE